MLQPLEKIRTLTNIDEINDLIGTYFKKPVVIEDEKFSLLAYSSLSTEQFDQANQQTIFSKRWPLSILEKFMDEGIVHKLQTIPQPFRIKQINDIGLNQRVVVSAKHNDKVWGYIWVQEIDEHLSEDEMEFLYEVSFYIGMLLFKENQFKLNKEQEKDRFYEKIIQGTFQSESQIKWEAANMNMTIPDTFLVNVFTIAQSDHDIFDELNEKIRLFANALHFSTHCFVVQLKIIVIIGSNTSYADRIVTSANELISKVISQFKGKKVYAGVGGIHSSALQLATSYKEALEVIQIAKFIGSPQQFTYEYEKLGISRYLEVIAAQQKNVNYVNEGLHLLQQKDIESQTKLIQTLEVFLVNNCRLKPTAEQLFIHLNTLKYRLKQITDLTAIDFDDFHTRCQLYIDLQLLKRESQVSL